MRNDRSLLLFCLLVLGIAGVLIVAWIFDQPRDQSRYFQNETTVSSLGVRISVIEARNLSPSEVIAMKFGSHRQSPTIPENEPALEPVVKIRFRLERETGYKGMHIVGKGTDPILVYFFDEKGQKLSVPQQGCGWPPLEYTNWHVNAFEKDGTFSPPKGASSFSIEYQRAETKPRPLPTIR